MPYHFLKSINKEEDNFGRNTNTVMNYIIKAHKINYYACLILTWMIIKFLPLPFQVREMREFHRQVKRGLERKGETLLVSSKQKLASHYNRE